MLAMNIGKGILFSLISVLGFSFNQTLVRWLGTAADTWAKALFRSFFGLMALLFWVLMKRIKLRFRNYPLLLVRGIAGGISLGLSFHAIDLLGLTKATLYLYSYPLFSPLFATLFFKEKFRASYLVPMAVAGLGLYLFAWPWQLSSQPGELIGLVCCISTALAISTLHRLGETESSSSIYFVFCAASLVVCLSGALFTPGALVIPREGTIDGGIIWVAFVLLGITSTVGQLFMTEAYRFIPTVFGSLLSLAIIPITLVIDTVGFHQPLRPLTVAGAILILLAGGLSTLLIRRPVKERA